MKINRLRIKSRISVLLSAAAFVTACQVDEPLELTDRFFPPDLVEVEEPEVTTFVFSSEGEDPETKTEHSGSTIIWSAGDMIRMGFTVNNVWQGDNGNAASYSSAMIYASTALAEGGPTADFSVPTTFTGNTQGTYKFYTLYPSSACGTGFESEGVVKATIPTEQTPAAASFDPKSDLLAGTSVRTYSSKPTEAIPLMWTRLVAHGEITLKNIKDLGGDETVESVTLTAQSGASLTGSYLLDLTTPAIGNGVEPSNSVTVKGNNLSFDGSNLTFWIGILPVTMTSLEVELKTDKATYTRSIPSCTLEFARNTHNRLGINMASATRVAKVQYYEKVTSSMTDWSGEYLIVYESGSLAFNGALGTTLYKNNTISVSISDNKIEKTSQTSSAQFFIAKSGNEYTIKSASGYFIGNDENTTYLGNDPDEAFTNAITYNTSGYVDIVASGGSYLRYNLNIGNTKNRFCYVKSTLVSMDDTPVIQLYKLGTSSTPTGATATVTTSAAGDIAQTTATLNGSFTGATGEISEAGFYYGTDENPTTKVVAAGTTSPFTYSLSGLSANTTYYFQAYVKEYNAATASVEERTGDVVSFTTESAGQTTQYYEKVTSALSDWSGEYLIVYEAGSLAFDGSLASLNTSGNYISVTISNGKIERTNTTSTAQFTVAKSGNNYTIKSSSGYYIGQTSDSNGLLFDQTNAYTNTLSLSDGSVNIVSSGGAYLRYNANTSNGLVFRYYKSSTYTNQQAIQLYKLGGSSGGGDTPATATATVTTSAATGVSATGATLNGSYSGATGAVSERGFYWGTSSNPATKVTVSSTSASFSYALTGLTSGTTYYFRAYVVEFNASTNAAEERLGSVVSFVAQQGSVNTPPGYLGCYEVPDVGSVSNYASGNEVLGSTKWSRWDTSNSKQKIVVHTFYNDNTNASENRAMRSYTLLQDKDKKCALWVACAMNNGAYPTGASRSDKWAYDPALDNDWQPNLTSGYQNFNGDSYDRGHQIGSAYRASTLDQRKMTCYFTNMTPQLSSLNQGAWNTQVEEKVRALGNATSGNDTLYVVSGPLFIGSYDTVNDVSGTPCARPTHYYQCFMKVHFDNGIPQSAKGAAYLIEHTASASAQYKTIDEIETLSGFDFFANVPSAIQNSAEASATPYSSF